MEPCPGGPGGFLIIVLLVERRTQGRIEKRLRERQAIGHDAHLDLMKILSLCPLILLAFSLSAAPADEALKSALVLHASFDKGLDAEFSKADPSAVMRSGGTWVPVSENEDIKLVPDAGRYGGALHFPKKGATRPSYRGEGVLGYNDRDWSATVSFWMRLDPDLDLEPGYCDPIQIVGQDSKKGFIFLEWSKDHSPRYFRYAIRPLIELWDPQGLGWENIPKETRPVVELKTAPFSRERWTHAVFTLEHLNAGKERSAGTLYLDGKKQGRIEGHDLRFAWDPASVMLVLGAAYVGYMDDLSVFDRVLTEEEVAKLHALPKGVAELRP